MQVMIEMPKPVKTLYSRDWGKIGENASDLAVACQFDSAHYWVDYHLNQAASKAGKGAGARRMKALLLQRWSATERRW